MQGATGKGKGRGGYVPLKQAVAKAHCPLRGELTDQTNMKILGTFRLFQRVVECVCSLCEVAGHVAAGQVTLIFCSDKPSAEQPRISYWRI